MFPKIKYLLFLVWSCLVLSLQAQENYCVGDTLVMDVLSSSSVMSISYQAIGGDTLVEISEIFVINDMSIASLIPEEISGEEIVIAKLNCEPGLCNNCDTISIKEVINIELEMNELVLCEGDSINLSVNGGTQYLWSTGDTTDNIWVKEDLDIITVEETNENFCSNIDTAFIAISQKPQIQSSSNAICQGDSIQLSVSNEFIDYTWSYENIEENDTNILEMILDETTIFFIEATDLINCTDSITIIVNEFDSDIEIQQDSIICKYDSVELSSLNDLVFDWGNDLIDSVFQLVITNDTTLHIIAIDSNNCRQEHQENINITQTNSELIGLNVSDEIVCPGELVTLSVTGGISFQWSENAANATTSLVEVLIEEPINDFSVKVIDSVNCEFTLDTQILSHNLPQGITFNLPNTTENGSSVEIFSDDNSIYLEEESGLMNQEDFEVATPFIQENSLEQILLLKNKRSPQMAHFQLFPKFEECELESILISTKVFPLSKDSLFIPEIFTPNSDGVNDTWQVQLVGKKENTSDYLIHIYNKNGVEIYQDLLSNEWNGQCNGIDAPDGVYWYIIEAPNKNYKGAITLLRN